MSLKSILELDRLLDSLHCQHSGNKGILVSVELSETGDSLAIGIGCDVAVLSYVPGDGKPPYFTSVGDERGDDVVVFRFMGDWTEFPVKNTVSMGAAREAVRHFCKTGKLSPEVRWEED